MAKRGWLDYVHGYEMVLQGPPLKPPQLVVPGKEVLCPDTGTVPTTCLYVPARQILYLRLATRAAS